MGYPNALTPMPGVAGGTYPASIWHDYMNVAHGSDCSDFPQPKEAVHFSSFYGHYSSTGSGGSRNYSSRGTPYSGSGNSTGGGTGGTTGGGTHGYDPRLYESPPQQAPKVAPPPTATPPSPGGGNGGGQGKGQGGKGPGGNGGK